MNFSPTKKKLENEMEELEEWVTPETQRWIDGCLKKMFKNAVPIRIFPTEEEDVEEEDATNSET